MASRSRWSTSTSSTTTACNLHRDVASSVDEAAALLRRMMTEPAFAEGVAALNEKRRPTFD